MTEERVLFAMGSKEAENSIRQRFIDDDIQGYHILDEVILYNDLKHIKSIIDRTNPSILFYREDFDRAKGNYEDEMMEILYFIISNYDIRIIFFAKNRKPGNALLASLASYGVYDIITSSKLSINEIKDSILNPKTNKDAIKFLPKPNIGNLNEDLFDVEEDNEDKSDDVKPGEIYDPHRERNPLGVIKSTQEIQDDTMIINKNDVDKNSENQKDNPFNNFLNSFINNNSQNNNKGSQKEEVEINSLNDFSKLLKAEETPSANIKENNEFSFPLLNNNKHMEPKSKENKVLDVEHIDNDFKESNNSTLNNQDNGGILDSFLNLFESQGDKNSHNRQQIISFYGPASGRGTTLTALTVASELANRGERVIYLEINDSDPVVFLWHDIISKNVALEDALEKIEYNDYKTVNDSIITHEDILSSGSMLNDIHRGFPKSLDFLLFSNSYNDYTIDSLTSSSIQKLLIYLLYQLSYNIIVLDINANIDISVVETLLLLSFKNFIVLDQNVSTISKAIRLFAKLDKKGLSFNNNGIDKNHFILNRYNKNATMNVKRFTQWTEFKNVLTVVDDSTNILNNIELGKLVYPNTRNREFKKGIDLIIKSI